MRLISQLIVVFGVLALASLFLLLRPDGSEMTAGRTDSPRPAQATPGPQAAGAEAPRPAAIPRIEIRHGKRVSGPPVMRVEQGDAVVLEFQSDAAGELHLHGYDLTLALRPGELASLRFTASHSGRFEYELHGHAHAAHQALGVIEVMPQ